MKYPEKHPVLETTRLRLSMPRRSDDLAFFKIRSNPEIYRFIDKQPFKTINEARNFIQKITEGISKKEIFFWGISLLENVEPIGSICLWNIDVESSCAELGYELLPRYQGQGIMSESLLAVINYAFKELDLRKLEAFTHRENKASTKLLEKFDFTLEPDRTDEGFPHNIIYSRENALSR